MKHVKFPPVIESAIKIAIVQTITGFSIEIIEIGIVLVKMGTERISEICTNFTKVTITRLKQSFIFQ